LKKLTTLLFAIICVCVSTANAQWEILNNEISKTEIRCMASIDNNLVIGTKTGLFVSSDDGKTWNRKIIESFNHSVSSIKVYKNNLFVATTGDTTKLWVSTNLGGSWENLKWCSSNKELLHWRISSIAVDDINVVILLEGLSNGTQVYSKCLTDGDKWVWMYSDDNLPLDIETITMTKNGVYMNLPASEGPSNEVYLYYSKSIQSSWDLLKLRSVDGIKLADGIRSTNLSDSILYLGTRLGKVFSSIDNGKTFNYLNKNIKLKYISSIVTDSENRLFVATMGTGVWATGNKGYTWIQTKGMSNINIKNLIINGDYVYAFGSPSGMFRAKLSDFNIRMCVNHIIKDRAEIFPNPAIDKITIFTNEFENLKVPIFNIYGEEVKQIDINKDEDISDLPNGSYFVHIGNEFKSFMVQR